MRISCVAMVRNEGEIIHEFAAHLLDMFDDIVVVDHMSDDGTSGFLRRLAKDHVGVQVVELRTKGYFQSAAMTALCQASPVLANADWVFFLDADEVLAFDSRAEFEAALRLQHDNAMIKLPWHNLVPASYDENRLLRREFHRPKENALHRKVAFQPRMQSVWPLIIGQGNHEVYATENGGPIPANDAFPLLHVPVRTFAQLEAKLAGGIKSYRDMGEQWDEGLGVHWIEIEKKLSEGGLNEAIANFVAARYGALPADQPWELSLDQMKAKGYTEMVLQGPLLEDAMALRDRYWTGPAGDDGTAASDWIDIDPETGKGQLFLDGAMAPVTMLPDAPPEGEAAHFTALTTPQPVVRREKAFGDPVMRFLENADHTIECIVPTSWGGHIPFMYALMAHARPRRYVELGSHHGASFFAACQALKDLDGPREAVAVDLWMGDEHAGFYDENVYRNFSDLLRTRFRNVGKMVRQDFTEASNRFDAGSIDVLHIDGLHTYEAVKHDYETWLPKVTENATILFHDTNVYERGFGVWKFWEEIKGEGASFNFKHTHGLGVLALGKQNPVADLLREIEERQLDGFVEGHFAHLGQLTMDSALYRERLRADALAATQRKGRPQKFYGKKKKTLPQRVVREVTKGLQKVRGFFAGG